MRRNSSLSEFIGEDRDQEWNLERSSTVLTALVAGLLILFALLSAIVSTAKADEATRATGVTDTDAATSAAVQLALEARLPGTVLTSVQPSPVAGLYEVVTGDNLFYVDATARHLVIGTIYDIETHRDVTQPRLEELGHTPAPRAVASLVWADLPVGSAVVQNPGAAHRVAVFADTDCPYCRELDRILAELPEIEVHTYLFPLLGGSGETARAVLCADDRAAALERAWQKTLPPAPPGDCGREALAMNMAFAEANGIQSTPQLVRTDGARVVGLRHAAFLDSWVRGSHTAVAQ